MTTVCKYCPIGKTRFGQQNVCKICYGVGAVVGKVSHHHIKLPLKPHHHNLPVSKQHEENPDVQVLSSGTKAG